MSGLCTDHLSVVADWVTSDTRVTSPDLLVSIDYDMLNISLKDHLSVRHTAFIFMGFANDTSLVLRTSYGLPAISRTHNLATVHYKARQTIKAGSIPLGIFPVSLMNTHIHISTMIKFLCSPTTHFSLRISVSTYPYCSFEEFIDRNFVQCCRYHRS